MKGGKNRRGRPAGTNRKAIDATMSWGAQFLAAKSGAYKNGVVDLAAHLAALAEARALLAAQKPTRIAKALFLVRGALVKLLEDGICKMHIEMALCRLLQAVASRDVKFFEDLAHHIKHAPRIGEQSDPVARLAMANGLGQLPPNPKVSDVLDILNRGLPRSHRVSEKRAREDMKRIGIQRRRPGREKKPGAS